jgi:hypothetical protein
MTENGHSSSSRIPMTPVALDFLGHSGTTLATTFSSQLNAPTMLPSGVHVRFEDFFPYQLRIHGTEKTHQQFDTFNFHRPEQ